MLSPLDIEFGVTYVVCSSMTVSGALYILRKVFKLNSFRFLKVELTLIIVFEVCELIQGINRFKQFTFIENGLFGVILATFGAFIKILSILLLFWNLSFEYWLSAKQLNLWKKSMSSDEDPELLNNNFTVKMDKYKRVDNSV